MIRRGEVQLVSRERGLVNVARRLAGGNAAGLFSPVNGLSVFH